jgi:hypothetical protein
MRTKVFFLTILTLLFAVSVLFISSCEKEPMSKTVQEELVPQFRSKKGQSSANCFNFQTSGVDVALGCACIPAPLVCPTEIPDFCNFGAKTFPITVGDYEGFMTSVVTGLEQMGNPPTGNGAMHLTLFHYFISEDGNHAFWTDDQAICAPGNNPSTCIVNDVLNIIGGCGDFEGAYGKFRNHGILTFDGGGELCPIFYLEGGEDFVPTGTIDFNLNGRVCAPGL